MASYNLGNVVGLIKSQTAPIKKYVLWGYILNPSFPDIVELRYWDDVAGAWVPLIDPTHQYWLRPVIDNVITAPPLSPANGDRYMIPPGATGAWSGKTDQIATWKSGAWIYTIPLDGYIVSVRTEANKLYDYQGIYGSGGTWNVNDFQVPIAPGTYIPATEKGSPLGVATLDSSALIPQSQIDSANLAYTPVSPGNWPVGMSKIWDALDYLVLASGGGGSGTVLSVASGNLNPLFTVVVSNPTTTPSFAFTAVNQAANVVYAGPTTGGAAVPSFRLLDVADIPNLAGTYLSITGGTLTGPLVLAADPATGLGAATKNYVDNLVTGLKFKVNARAASVANVNIASAPSAVDGVTLAVNDRVVLKNQSTASQNGIYIFNGVGVAMTRALDGDTGPELVSATFPVSEGTVNADTWWTITNDTITIGVTNIVFTQTAGAGTYVAGAGIVITGNSIALNNAYFTGEATVAAGVVTLGNAAVIGKVLTGFASGAGAITAGDSILTAIQKLDANIVANTTNLYWKVTGNTTLTGVATVISNARNQHIFNGTWTNVATGDTHIAISPTITFVATSTQAVAGLKIAPAFTFNNSTQNGIGLSIEPTWNDNGQTNFTHTYIRAFDGTTARFTITDSGATFASTNNTLTVQNGVGGPSIMASAGTLVLGSTGIAISLQVSGNGWFGINSNNGTGILVQAVATTVTSIATQQNSRNFNWSVKEWTGSAEQVNYWTMRGTMSTTVQGESYLDTYYGTTGGAPSLASLWMRQTNTGNTGFGFGTSTTVVPSSRLQVRGVGTTTGGLALFEDSSATARLTITDQGDVTFNVGSQILSVRTGATNSVRLSAAGSVFFGSTAGALIGSAGAGTGTPAIGGSALAYRGDGGHWWTMGGQQSTITLAGTANYSYTSGFTAGSGSFTGNSYVYVTNVNITGGTPVLINLDTSFTGTFGSAVLYAAVHRQGYYIIGGAPTTGAQLDVTNIVNTTNIVSFKNNSANPRWTLNNNGQITHTVVGGVAITISAGATASLESITFTGAASNILHELRAGITDASSTAGLTQTNLLVSGTFNTTAAFLNGKYISIDVNHTITNDVGLTHYGLVVRNPKSLNGFGGGATLPTSTLHVVGSLALNITTVSANTTLDYTYYTVLVDASGGNRTITLPPAATTPGRIYIIKKIDATANTVTIDANGAETIDGVLTKVINTQWSGYTVQSTGTNQTVLAQV